MKEKISTVITTIAVIAIIFFGFMPIGRALIVKYEASMQKAEEVSYETQKSVESTCRSMIAAYKSDIDIYNLYKDSDNINQRNYADAALVRAVKTANEYNEYILKNSFVWRDNVPKDIYMSLDTDIK